LLLHLMLATLPSKAWPDVLRIWSGGLPVATGQGPPEAAAPAGRLETPAPDAALIAGIAAYRRHPWRRTMREPPVIWAQGSSRLLDFGQSGDPPVLVVPSLVNRAYVLDLLPGASMLRYLAEAGLRPLLLDWGMPGREEQDFTLTDYIAGRLEAAAASVGGKMALAGYCMGGLMAVALARRRPDLVTSLALLATPWDFWADQQGAPARALAALLPLLEPAFATCGTLPVDALQMLFSLSDPGSVGRKYRDFSAQDQTTARARRFVAIEDWLNDGVPLVAPVAREVLAEWYGRNTPAEGAWRVAGAPVRPELLAMPCFVAVPDRDRIVPAQSALAMARRIPGAVLHQPRAGHVGMVAGSGARAALWAPLAAWLGAQPRA
jgi:poly(3-hydroxyalkanoate) synthetase